MVHATHTLTSENGLPKHDWAIVKVFLKGLGENIRHMLDLWYHNQLKNHILLYQNVIPRQYIQHLKTVWVVFDGPIVEEPKKNFITGFPIHLDEDLAKLIADGLTISNTDKLQHYMLQM